MCIAVDDEPLALDLLEDYANQTGYLTLAKTFTDPITALEYINDNKVDLVFLDIQMPKLKGNELAKILNDDTQIIFTTAYEKYATEAFDLEATDYLVKPIEFDRFLAAVNKVQKKKSSENSILKKYIFIRTEYHFEKIDTDDIYFVKGMGDYLQIHTTDKKLMTLMSFNDLEKKLPPQNFHRVHRSYLVALPHIERIENSEIKIQDVFIPIGRTYRKSFFDVLNQADRI